MANAQLAWREWDCGEPDACRIVCIPGLGDSSQTYRLLLEALAERYSVILVDPPGFGASSVHPDPDFFTCDTLRDGLREFIIQRHLNRPRTILLGNSLGGAFAMGILASLGRRNRINRTVLLSPAGYPQPLNFWIRAQGLPLFTSLAKLLPKEFLARLILKDSMGDFTLLTREVIDDVVSILRSRWGMHAFMCLCRNIIRLCRDARNGKNNILSSLVPKFRHATARRPDGTRGTVDVLLIYGDRDNKVPIWVPQRIAEEVPNVRAIPIPGMGHLPQQEQPSLVARAIDEFVKRSLNLRSA